MCGRDDTCIAVAGGLRRGRGVAGGGHGQLQGRQHKRAPLHVRRSFNGMQNSPAARVAALAVRTCAPRGRRHRGTTGRPAPPPPRAAARAAGTPPQSHPRAAARVEHRSRQDRDWKRASQAPGRRRNPRRAPAAGAAAPAAGQRPAPRTSSASNDVGEVGWPVCGRRAAQQGAGSLSVEHLGCSGGTARAAGAPDHWRGGVQSPRRPPRAEWRARPARAASAPSCRLCSQAQVTQFVRDATDSRTV